MPGFGIVSLHFFNFVTEENAFSDDGNTEASKYRERERERERDREIDSERLRARIALAHLKPN